LNIVACIKSTAFSQPHTIVERRFLRNTLDSQQ
jgi:hypothetical protein